MRTNGEAEIGYVEYPIDPHGHGTIVGEVVVCPKNTYTERDIADRVAARASKKSGSENPIPVIGNEIEILYPLRARGCADS